MKLKNPLRNYLTPNEQRIMLFFLGFLLLGSVLDFAGWTPLQATKADADSLNLALKTDTPLRVDIRKAGLEELMTLSGIGEKRAKDIISFREANFRESTAGSERHRHENLCQIVTRPTCVW